MSPTRKKPAPPNVADVDDVLARRFESLQVPKSEQPAVEEKRPATSTRPAPEGMRRVTLYVTAEAADALETAADQVQAAVSLAKKADALSGLLLAAAGHTDQVAADLRARILRELG